MGTRHDLPPRGYYTASEVSRLAGVSGKTIGQWARHGFIQSSQSEGRPRVYSYQDVGEAMVVHLLRDRGAKWADIRTATETLRRRYGTDWPLSCSDIATSGSRIVAVDGGSEYDVGKGWQRYFDPQNDLERVRDWLCRGGWAAQQVDSQHIEVDPDRLSGTPVIRGSRVPAAEVAELAAAPHGRETLREGYDLSDDEIDDAVRWWDAVKEYEAA